MTKPLLNYTKEQFADYCQFLPDKVWYLMATTPFNSRDEIARFRRCMIRTLNNINHRELRGRL